MMAIRQRITLVLAPDGGGVVLDQRRGLYFQLNRSAATTLQCFLRGKTTAQTVEVLTAAYSDVSRESLLDDVTQLLRVCVGRGWIDSP